MGSKIYMTPMHKNHIGVFDTETEEYSTIAVYASSDPKNMANGPPASIGTKLYICPNMAGNVMAVIDTTTDTASLITLDTIPTYSSRRFAGSFAVGDKVICVPYGDSTRVSAFTTRRRRRGPDVASRTWCPTRRVTVITCTKMAASPETWSTLRGTAAPASENTTSPPTTSTRLLWTRQRRRSPDAPFSTERHTFHRARAGRFSSLTSPPTRTKLSPSPGRGHTGDQRQLSLLRRGCDRAQQLHHAALRQRRNRVPENRVHVCHRRVLERHIVRGVCGRLVQCGGQSTSCENLYTYSFTITVQGASASVTNGDHLHTLSVKLDGVLPTEDQFTIHVMPDRAACAEGSCTTGQIGFTDNDINSLSAWYPRVPSQGRRSSQSLQEPGSPLSRSRITGPCRRRDG